MGFQFLSEIITSILRMNYSFSKCKRNEILDHPHQIPQQFMMDWSLAIIFRQELCMERSCRSFFLIDKRWRFKKNFACLDAFKSHDHEFNWWKMLTKLEIRKTSSRCHNFWRIIYFENGKSFRISKNRAFIWAKFNLQDFPTQNPLASPRQRQSFVQLWSGVILIGFFLNMC